MLLRAFISSARKSLSVLYPEEESKAIVSRLCEDLLGVTAYAHILDPAIEVPGESLPGLQSALERLAGGEPLQYVLGYSYFSGRKFLVTPDVLIPRPETEQLCDIVIRQGKAGMKVLDLCTGSGCIAWTLACAFPCSGVLGLDVSYEALAVAASQEISIPENCIRPEFIRYDVLSDPSGLDRAIQDAMPSASDDLRFDIVVCNPPYIRESEKPLMHRNVLDHEPGLALFVPDSDPLVFYRAIAAIAETRLRPGGFGAVEINEAFGPPVAGIFSDAGFRDVCMLEDFRSKIRFVTFRK